MLVPRAFWRPVGALAGRVAPRPMRAYYRAVVRAYTGSLRRTARVRSLYTFSSFVGGNFRPGRSDVDLVAVTEASSAETEVELLEQLRGPFRRFQALLPIDVWPIPEGEFGITASWVTAMRPRAADDRPTRAVSQWTLLAGDELRSDGVSQPDPRLAFIGDYFVRGAIELVGSHSRPSKSIARDLAELERDAKREGLRGAPLEDLTRARARLARGVSRADVVEAAIHAALLLVEQHRRLHSVPYELRVASEEDSRIPRPDDEAKEAAAGLLGTLGAEVDAIRSATLYVPPFEVLPQLLLECRESDACSPIVRWLVRGGGAKAAWQRRLKLHVLSSVVAEDSWRDGLACYAIAAGWHLLGEPLAPRLGLPSRQLQIQALHYLGFWEATAIRWALIGHRRYQRDDRRPLRLAAERVLAAGEAPVLDPVALIRELPELSMLRSDEPEALADLDDATWARLGLEIWRGWPDVRTPVEPRTDSDGRAPPEP